MTMFGRDVSEFHAEETETKGVSGLGTSLESDMRRWEPKKVLLNQM